MDEQLALTSRVEAEHFWFRGFRAFITPLIEEAAAGRRGLRLLDCGCGTGHNLSLLTPHGRAYGFDLTLSGLLLARHNAGQLARADITRIPFQSASIDLLTSFDVLQYVDDGAAFAEMARVLRPGGKAIITAAALDVLRGGHAAEWPEVRRYTRGGIRQVAEQAGLQVERAAYLFGTIFPMMLGVRAWRRVFEGDGGEEDWEMNVPAAPVNEGLTLLLRAEAAITRYAPLAPAGSSVLLVARKP